MNPDQYRLYKTFRAGRSQPGRKVRITTVEVTVPARPTIAGRPPEMFIVRHRRFEAMRPR
jgi:hypothetical protein